MSFEIDIDNTDHHYRSDASVFYPIGNPSEPIGYVELSEPLDFGTNLLDQLKQALVTAGVGAVSVGSHLRAVEQLPVSIPYQKPGKHLCSNGSRKSFCTL